MYDDLPAVMSVMDVAQVLKVSRNTAYEAVHSAGFPAFTVGKQIRVSKAAFIEWLHQQGQPTKQAS